MDRPSPEPPSTRLPGLDDSERLSWQQFTDAVTHVYATVNRQLIDAHGLNLFDVMLLRLLANSDRGFCRMGELAEAVAVRPSRVSGQIRRLEGLALVRRTSSSVDRRGVNAAITRLGRARLAPALETYAAAVRTLYLDPMSRQQMTAMGDSCRRVDTALRDPKPPAKRTRP